LSTLIFVKERRYVPVKTLRGEDSSQYFSGTYPKVNTNRWEERRETPGFTTNNDRVKQMRCQLTRIII